MKKTRMTFILILVSLSHSLLADQPWEKHGPLKVSANRHAIVHEDGTPFLWIGDTAWGLFQQLTREQVNQYLDNRQRKGFTVIQAVGFWYPHGGGLPSGPHNAANAYGHRPFSGDDDHPNTAQPLLMKGGGPDQPNDYWDHVDFVIQAVKKRGMYLAFLPCWGRAYITQEFRGAHNEFTVMEAKAYGEFLGQCYKNEPHLLWVLGGDAKAQQDSYDKRPVFRAMAEGLAQGVTGAAPAWNQHHSAWDRLFLTYHPDGHATLNSSSWFQQDAWLTANGVEVWKEVDQVYPVMWAEYQRTDPVKPSLFLEGSYEYGSYNHEPGWVTPLRVRRQFYHTFFAGGTGHTYGAGPIWAMRGSEGDYSGGFTWQQALDFPGAAQVATLGRTFLQQHHWPDWISDPCIIQEGIGTGECRKAAIQGTTEKFLAIYFADSSKAGIRNNLSTRSEAHWFDPRTGDTVKAGMFEAHESRMMSPPGDWEDAILILASSS
jgi:hypothetical protein